MIYHPRKYEHLLGTNGFSVPMLSDHFLLYKGYVSNTNKLMEELEFFVSNSKTGEPEYAELRRRFGWEFNGMRLHEYYFGNMTKDATQPDFEHLFFKNMANDFGSYGNWEREFRAIGAIRGIGWAVLYYDPIGLKLFNVWVNEHDVGHLFSAIPLLVMDVFEHAYMTDYRLNRKEYIDAFFNAIDWNEVKRRFKWLH